MMEISTWLAYNSGCDGLRSTPIICWYHFSWLFLLKAGVRQGGKEHTSLSGCSAAENGGQPFSVSCYLGPTKFNRPSEDCD